MERFANATLRFPPTFVSETCIRKFDVPTDLFPGVPEITPVVLFSFRPFGNLPEPVSFHWYGGLPPLAERACE